MKLREIDLNLLVAFDALLRERHVTRAADRLDMSQSSMSLALAKLRDQLRDDILIRSPSGLVATQRAEEIWPKVRTAIDACKEVFQPPAAFDPATATHNFRLIVIDYIDLLVMPLVMRRLREEAPQVTVEMLQPKPHNFGDIMAAGELDLALSYFPAPPDFLKARKLFSDRFVGVGASRNRALDGTLDAAQFCALPHVTIEPEGAQIYNVLIEEALAPMGLRRRVQMVKPSFLALPFLLETTDMVSCLPERLAKRMGNMADVKAVDLPFELQSFDVRMLWHPRTAKSAAHEWFRSLVVECARSF